MDGPFHPLHELGVPALVFGRKPAQERNIQHMLRRIIGYLPAYRARIIHFLPMIRKIYNKGVPALPFYGIDDAGHDVVRVPYGIIVRIDILFSLSVRHGFVGISSVEENTPNSGGYRNAYVRWEPIK